MEVQDLDLLKARKILKIKKTKDQEDIMHGLQKPLTQPKEMEGNSIISNHQCWISSILQDSKKEAEQEAKKERRMEVEIHLDIKTQLLILVEQ
jgi:hypothetical protein